MSAWYNWYETAPQIGVNPAASIFTGQLNEVGRTYPVFNGIVTWTSMASLASGQIAAALNAPLVHQIGSRFRISQPRRNTASAVIRIPGNGPWSATVPVQAIRQFAAGDTQSAEALRPVLGSLPAGGDVNVRIPANPNFGNNTLAHERQHAQDIRQVCNSILDGWTDAVIRLVGTMFDSETALDAALFEAAGLTTFQGNRMARLGSALLIHFGMDASFLHLVADHNQFRVDHPRWIAAGHTLEFSLTEAGRPVAQRRSRGVTRVA